MNGRLAREAAKLYALPEAEYTRSRNARAKALRKDDAELARQVEQLPKPTRPLATINRLAREDPSEVRALIQSGKRLRKVQEGALRGGKEPGAALRDATGEFREALDRLQRQARKDGLSDSLLGRVAATLRTAALDPELQPLLERGLLSGEPEPAGFVLDPALAAGAPKRAAAKRPDGAARRKEREQLAAARARLVDAKKAAADAERELTGARRAVTQAEAAAAKAAGEVEAAAAELAELERG